MMLHANYKNYIQYMYFFSSFSKPPPADATNLCVTLQQLLRPAVIGRLRGVKGQTPTLVHLRPTCVDINQRQ